MKRLEELERAVIADPEDIQAHIDLAVAKGKLDPSTLLYPLYDQFIWQETPGPIQDLAIKEAARRLDNIELIDIKTWSCENVAACKKCGGEGFIEDGNFLEGEYDVLNQYSIEEHGLSEEEAYVHEEGYPTSWRLIDRSDYCTECWCKTGSGFVTKQVSFRLGLFLHRKTKIEFSLIPGRFYHRTECLAPGKCGNYISDFGDDLCRNCVDKIPPFLIGRWPVVYSNWHIRFKLGSIPITNWDRNKAITWADSYGLCLPTEREWVHACKAGTDTQYYWGSRQNLDHCWHGQNSRDECGPCAQAVSKHESSKAWNAFGLVDMIGNVREYLSFPCSSIGSDYNYHWIGNVYTPTLIEADADAHSATGFRVMKQIPGIKYEDY